MRGWKRKWLALALALCLLLPGGTALAQGEDEAAGPYIPFGEDVRGYDPAKDGYYALLPMQYETGTDRAGPSDPGEGLCARAGLRGAPLPFRGRDPLGPGPFARQVGEHDAHLRL